MNLGELWAGQQVFDGQRAESRAVQQAEGVGDAGASGPS
jgi:hypothetical protein